MASNITSFATTKKFWEDLSSVSPAPAKSTHVSPENLDYGKKHKGLTEIATFVDRGRFPGIRTCNPEGFPTQHVEKFLRKTAPSVFESMEKLNGLYEAHRKSLGAPAEFLQDKQVNELLESIQDKIKEAFNSVSSNVEVRRHLQNADKYISWLEACRKAGELIMVRSSGDEDSAEAETTGIKYSTAGGNKSFISNPTPEETFTKMGMVVASYFSADSLRIRLNAGSDPFKGTLKLAATSQALVGEPIGGAKSPDKIPVSVEMFTHEPNYGVNYRVTKISCSYGHGEGVVGEKGIACDTIYVIQSTENPDDVEIIYSNRQKPVRLVPIQGKKGIELSPIQNPAEFVSERALSKETILRLARFGQEVEKFRKTPTDMELVVKEGQIVPVQWRNLNRQVVLPSYFDISKLPSNHPVHYSDVLTSGHSSVCELPSKDQVLFSNTLEDNSLEGTERAFIDKKHRLVIVEKGKEAEPLSANLHTIVNYEEMQVPCFHSDNIQEIQKTCDKAGQDGITVGVCEQQGAVFPWNEKTDGPLKAHVKEGHISHPAPMSISLEGLKPLAVKSKENSVPDDLKAIFWALKSRKERAVAQEKLKELSTHSLVLLTTQKKNYLKSKIRSLGALAPEQAIQAVAAAEQIEKMIDRTLERVGKKIASATTDRLDILFDVKVLESLFCQTSDENAVSKHSLMSIQDALDFGALAVEHQEKFNFPTRFTDALMAADDALSKKSGEDWCRFIEWVEKTAQSGSQKPQNTSELEVKVNKEDFVRFKELVAQLQETDSFPFWLAFYFDRYNKPGRSHAAILEDILKDFTPETCKFLQGLAPLKERLRIAQGMIPSFGDPNRVAAAMEHLNDLAKWVSKPAFSDSFKQASPLGQVIAAQILAKVVETYDVSMKTLQRSHAIDKKEKVELFFKLLRGDLKEPPQFIGRVPLFITFAKDMIGIKRFGVKDYTFQLYVGTLKDQLSDAYRMKDYVDQLKPSRNFDVSGALFCSLTAFSRHLPQTGEDLLQTLHQNELAALQCVNAPFIKADMFDSLKVPQVVKDLIMSAGTLSEKMQCIGVEVTTKEVAVHYNIPLDYHSAGLVIKYNRKTGKVMSHLKFLGQDRGTDRWNAVKIYSDFITKIDLIPQGFLCKKNSLYFEMSWEVTSKTDIKMLLNHFKALFASSIGPCFTLSGYLDGFENKDDLLKLAELIKLLRTTPENWLLKYNFLNELGKGQLTINQEPKRKRIPMAGVHAKNLIFEMASHPDPNMRKKAMEELRRSLGTKVVLSQHISLLKKLVQEPVKEVRLASFEYVFNVIRDVPAHLLKESDAKAACSEKFSNLYAFLRSPFASTQEETDETDRRKEAQEAYQLGLEFASLATKDILANPQSMNYSIYLLWKDLIDNKYFPKDITPLIEFCSLSPESQYSREENIQLLILLIKAGHPLEKQLVVSFVQHLKKLELEKRKERQEVDFYDVKSLFESVIKFNPKIAEEIYNNYIKESSHPYKMILFHWGISQGIMGKEAVQFIEATVSRGDHRLYYPTSLDQLQSYDSTTVCNAVLAHLMQKKETYNLVEPILIKLSKEKREFAYFMSTFSHPNEFPKYPHIHPFMRKVALTALGQENSDKDTWSLFKQAFP